MHQVWQTRARMIPTIGRREKIWSQSSSGNVPAVVSVSYVNQLTYVKALLQQTISEHRGKDRIIPSAPLNQETV